MKSAVPDLIDAQVLIVVGDEDTSNVIQSGLTEFNNVEVFHNGDEALNFCRLRAPDIILLDLNIPQCGLELCREIREMSLLTRCPVIFLSDDTDLQTEVKSWEAGGNDFLRKPISAAALNMRVMSHLTSHWHIEIANRLHHTDALTGLNNRYYFDKHIKEQIAYATRYKSDLSMLIIDINCFRQFNEDYGHAHGDKALKRVATALRSTVSREPDSVCRYAGEEFTVILPGTDNVGASVVANKIIDQVNQLAIPFASELSGFLSVSIGQTCLSTAIEQSETLFSAADKHLKLIKSTGQSQVA